MRSDYFLLILLLSSMVFANRDVYGQNYGDVKFYEVDSLNLDALSPFELSLLDSSLQVYHSAQHDTDKVLALGAICEGMVHPDRAKYHFLQLSVIKRSLENKPTKRTILKLKELFANALNCVSALYSKQGNVVRAVDYLNRSLRLQKEMGNKRGEVYSLNNIGIILIKSGKFDEALDYFKEALRLFDEINDERGRMSCLLNLGALFGNQNKLDKSIQCFEEVLKYRRKINDEVGISEALLNLGIIYKMKGDLNRAIEYLDQSLVLFEKTGQKENKPLCLKTLAYLYLKQNKLEVAQEVGEEALELAKENGFPLQILDVADVMVQIYEEKGEFKKALNEYRLFVQMDDSINNSRTEKEIEGMIKKLDLEKKDHQIQLLRKEKQLKETRLKSSIFVSIVALGLTIVIARVLFLRRNRRFEEELNILRKLKLESLESKNDSQSVIPINVGRKIITREFNEVVAFRAEDKYVFLIDKQGKPFIVDETIASLEKKLPQDFVRVHRASIINRKEIKTITKTTRGKVAFTMKDKELTKIHSSQGYPENVEVLVNEFKLGTKRNISNYSEN